MKYEGSHLFYKFFSVQYSIWKLPYNVVYASIHSFSTYLFQRVSTVPKYNASKYPTFTIHVIGTTTDRQTVLGFFFNEYYEKVKWRNKRCQLYFYSFCIRNNQSKSCWMWEDGLFCQNHYTIALGFYALVIKCIFLSYNSKCLLSDSLWYSMVLYLTL